MAADDDLEGPTSNTVTERQRLGFLLLPLPPGSSPPQQVVLSGAKRALKLTDG